MAASPQPDNPLPRVGHVALIADDDAIIRDILRSFLSEAGYTVISAATGREALALAAYLDGAVAILDLDMPNGDGLQACASLRQMAGWQHVPILILTSYHTDKALQAARRAGASGFVCKPFVPSELLRRIASLTTGISGPGPPDPVVWQRQPSHDITASQTPNSDRRKLAPTLEQEAGPFARQRAVLQVYRRLSADEPDPSEDPNREDAQLERRRLKILVAEDEKLTREIVSHVLGQEGYLVHLAANGQEALAAVIRGHYDLVLMDVGMPVLNGFGAARMIRSLPNDKRHTPVIAMTANVFSHIAQEMQDAGMNGYLMKPVNPTALLNCVHQQLDGEAGQPVIQPGFGRPSRTLDLELLQDQAKLFAPGAMRRFLDNLTQTIAEVLPSVQGWVSSEPADLRRRLHNLAGIAGTLGCTRLSDIARELESETAPADAVRQRFVETARASVAAIRQYCGA